MWHPDALTSYYDYWFGCEITDPKIPINIH